MTTQLQPQTIGSGLGGPPPTQLLGIAPNEPRKQCSTCHEWKPATTEYFYAHVATKDGLDSQCKACKRLSAQGSKARRRARLKGEAAAAPQPEPTRPSTTQASTELERTILEYLIAERQAGKAVATVGKSSPLPLCQQGDETLGNYGYTLRRLAAWLQEQAGVTTLAELDRATLRTWGASLREAPSGAKKPSEAYIRLRVSAVRSFLKWCREEGLIEADLAAALKLPKVKGRIQRTLTAEEVRAVYEACDTQELTGLRNLALISLLVDSGLRVSEVARLKLTDLRFGVTVAGANRPINLLTVKVKGGNEEYAYFGEQAAQHLIAWLAALAEWAREDNEYVFVALGGLTPTMPLTRTGIKIICRRLAKAAGIPGFSPHALRRTFACLTVEAGAPTRVVMSMGRWRHLTMLEAYTRAFEVAKQVGRFSVSDYLNKLQEVQNGR